MNNGLLPALVIFDCDGVLVESEAIANRVFAEMVSKAGYPLTAEDSLRRFKGGRFKSLQAVTGLPNFMRRCTWRSAKNYNLSPVLLN